METTKKWYQSKGILGSLVAGASIVAGFFGIDVLGADQAELIQIVTTVAGSIGALFALVGRYTAKKDIA